MWLRFKDQLGSVSKVRIRRVRWATRVVCRVFYRCGTTWAQDTTTRLLVTLLETIASGIAWCISKNKSRFLFISLADLTKVKLNRKTINLSDSTYLNTRKARLTIIILSRGTVLAGLCIAILMMQFQTYLLLKQDNRKYIPPLILPRSSFWFGTI